MEMLSTGPTATKRPVWNAGRTVGAKRALKPKQIWEIRFYLNQQRRVRDRALFDLAIDSKLRGCDLVRMKIGDLVSSGQIRTLAIVMQQKTGRPVQFELLKDARASLLTWLERRGGTVDDYVFPSRIDHDEHLSTRQYARLVDELVTGVGLMRSEYGTHSLRRSWKRQLTHRALPPSPRHRPHTRDEPVEKFSLARRIARIHPVDIGVEQEARDHPRQHCRIARHHPRLA